MKKIFIAALILLLGVLAYTEEIMIVAHRGASHDAPENTIPAFELAWKQGADAIEGDFRLTQDGHIVCFHDEDTQDLAGKKLIVEKSPLAELRKLDVGAHHGEAFKGTVIPTISDVFSTIPENKKIYIEIKCGTEIVTPLLEEIKTSDLKEDQVVFISFNAEVIQTLKTDAPQYKAFWLSGFKKNKLGKKKPSHKTVLKTLKEIRADGLSSSHKIDEALVKKVQAAGYEYHVWTVDAVQTAKRFKKWGAKSITTNVPEKLRAGLNP